MLKFRFLDRAALADVSGAAHLHTLRESGLTYRSVRRFAASKHLCRSLCRCPLLELVDLYRVMFVATDNIGFVLVYGVLMHRREEPRSRGHF